MARYSGSITECKKVRTFRLPASASPADSGMVVRPRADSGMVGRSDGRMHAELLDHESPEQRHRLGGWPLDAVIVAGERLVLYHDVAR